MATSKHRHNRPDQGRLTEDNSARHGHIIATFTLVTIIVMLIAGAIIFMLVNNTVIHRNEWNAVTVTRTSDTRTEVPVRGDIYADDGSILATNLLYYDLSIDFRTPRFMIIEYDSLAGELAKALATAYPQKGRTAAEWEEYLRKPIKTKARKDRSRGYMLLRHMPAAEVQRIKNTFPFFNLAKRSDSTGLVATPVSTRVYPYGEMAKLSIGRIGYIDSTWKYKNDPVESKKSHVSRGMHGTSGLERAFDSLLYGTEGVKRKLMFQHHEGYWTETKAVRGCDVYSTIDIGIQDILEQELGKMIVDSHAQWGTALIMEVATGDIKAISNLERDSVNGGFIEAYNRAVLGYEPGSVAKVMTMAVALNWNYADLNRVYPIGRDFYYLKRRISDTHSPAALPVSRFIEYSSNIGMVKLTYPQYTHDPNLFRERLRELGFFDRFNTGIAGETPPYYPTLKHNTEGQLDLSRVAFGYHTRIPPLYTCAFFNAIANDGKFVRPRLYSGLRLPDGRDSVIPVSYVREQMLSPQDNAALKEMLRSVVWGEGGTAKALRNDTVVIAGKTGTCKIMTERPPVKLDKNGDTIPQPPFRATYIDGHYRVTFCGFFPYDKPKYTCIVVIQDPRGALRGASASCGKVLKNVALKLYARGKLDNTSDYTTDGATRDLTPTLYASHKANRSERICREYGITQTKVINKPEAFPPEHTVPDVRGLGIREAVVKLEEAGLNVKFHGTGFVTAQTPPAGEPVIPGSKVTLQLHQL